MARIKELWARHQFVGCIVFTLICVGIPFMFSGKAFSATDRGICQPSHRVECVTPQHAAKLFRQGHYTRSHGIPMAKIFKRPAKAKRIWAQKITVWVKHHPKKARLAARGATRTKRSVCPKGMGSLVCDIYQKALFESTCVSMAPTPSKAPGICHFFNEPYIDISILQKAGAVTFCGGAVILGVAASPETGGGTAFIAAWGAASCGWSFWSSF